jgi:acetate kinase
MPRAVLALNAGSSSIKFALAEMRKSASPHRVASGEIEGIGTAPHLIARDEAGKSIAEHRWSPDSQPTYDALLDTLLAWIETHLGADTLAAVGHRVVHGGLEFTAPIRVTPAVLDSLAALTPLAPLHQPHNLAPIRAILALRPDLPQVACFDTAFHHTQPAVATRFALPRAYEAEGVRRYGFHGLSYEYIASRLNDMTPDLAHGRVIVAHLGNGASLCAMQSGQSIDTTMGFTALDGLMMGTRCGSIDAGVLLYMQQQKGLTVQQVENVLYNESGLLGVSGLSSDMRDLLASPDPRAKEAIDLFVYRIARETAALAGSLGGLDGFVFTAGIGEHAAQIRAAVCERLRWLGVVPDPGANLPGAALISAHNSRVEVRVIPTDEEAMIHRHTIASLNE